SRVDHLLLRHPLLAGTLFPGLLLSFTLLIGAAFARPLSRGACSVSTAFLCSLIPRAIALQDRVQFSEFLAAEFPILSQRNPSESKRTKADPFQFHHLVADTRQQAADFAVLPFRHRNLDPGALFLLFHRANV